jgi:hypothetical protein
MIGIITASGINARLGALDSSRVRICLPRVVELLASVSGSVIRPVRLLVDQTSNLSVFRNKRHISVK